MPCKQALNHHLLTQHTTTLLLHTKNEILDLFEIERFNAVNISLDCENTVAKI